MELTVNNQIRSLNHHECSVIKLYLLNQFQMQLISIMLMDFPSKTVLIEIPYFAMFINVEIKVNSDV